MGLLERADAVKAIGEALGAARSGGPGVLFLVGEPGLGKTSLVRHCCEQAGAAGMRTVTARCSEVGSTLPFGLLEQLLPAEGLPATGWQASSSSAEARMASYARALAWVRGPAPDQGDGAVAPLLVAIDDLHWADADSLGILSLVCRRLGGLGVAFVAALRPWPRAAHEQATALADEGWARLARLEPLSDGASQQLLDDCLSERLPEPLAGQAIAACAGNPLLLRVLAGSQRQGATALAGGPGGLAGRLLVPRFAGVGPGALRWARAASVLGSQFHVHVVGLLSGQSGREAAEALEALCDAGLVEGGPDGKACFAHPLFHQVLYESVPPPVAQAMHASAFRLLLAAGFGAAEAAPHAVAAHLRGDQAAVDALMAAGRSALAAGAVVTAALHLENALALSPEGALPAGAGLELAEAYLATGNVGQAAQVLRRTLDQPGLPERERASALVLMGEAARGVAPLAEAHRYFADAARLAQGFDPALAARIPMDVAFVDWYFVGPARARAAARQSLEGLLTAGASGAGPGPRAEALCADAYLALLEGDPGGLGLVEERALAQMGSMPRPPAWRWDVVNAWANMARFTRAL